MTQKSVADLAVNLDVLTQQLNEFRPMREAEATADAEQLSGSVDARLQTQTVRMDQLSQSMQDTRKESAPMLKPSRPCL